MFPQRNQHTESTYLFGWAIVSVSNALLKAKVGNTELDALKWINGCVLSVFEMPFLVRKVLFCSC